MNIIEKHGMEGLLKILLERTQQEIAVKISSGEKDDSLFSLEQLLAEALRDEQAHANE